MALSSLITVEKLEDSKQQLYVPLCDVLLDLVETNIDGPDALMFSKTAHSLAHDILNMATLAGRLLWCEGVTPDMGAIEKQLDVRRSHTHVLSGVYVPALHHLLAYEQPQPGHLLNEEEMRRRHIAAWHLLKAGDYLSAAERGYPDDFWWRFATHLCDLFTAPPRYVSEAQFARWRLLIDWKFVFQGEEQNVALCLREMVLAEEEWVKGAQVNLDDFAQRAGATGSLLVAREVTTPRNSPTDIALPANFIADADPVRAAERAFAALKPPKAAAAPNDACVDD